MNSTTTGSSGDEFDDGSNREEPADGIGPSDPDRLVSRIAESDPAWKTDPEPARLLAAINARLEENAGAGLAPGEAPQTGNDIAAAKLARTTKMGKRQWQQVAAGFAILAVFAGGYGLGALRAEVPEAAVGIDPGTTTMPMPLATPPSGYSSSPEDNHGYGLKTVFSSAGLSTEEGTAEAFTYNPSAVFNTETASNLADIFGLTGEPIAQNDGQITVGSTNNTGPSVTIQSDSQGFFTFSDPDKAIRCEDDNSCATSCSNDTVSGPKADQAIGKLKGVLNSLDLDSDSMRYIVEACGEVTSVSAFRIINGFALAEGFRAQFTPKGLEYINGTLAPITSLGNYTVVSPEQAVARLADPRFGVSLFSPVTGETDVPLTDGEPGATSSGTIEPDPSAPKDAPTQGPASIEPAPPTGGDLDGGSSPPPTLEPGSAIRWPITSETIVRAELGLSSHPDYGQGVTLVPTYYLYDDSGQAWSVIAVSDVHLDFTRR